MDMTSKKLMRRMLEHIVADIHELTIELDETERKAERLRQRKEQLQESMVDIMSELEE